MRLTEANLAIQCTATTGEVGTFLYTQTLKGREPVSPVFPGVIEFFKWAHENGWVEKNPHHTMTPYVKEEETATAQG